jgi:hypothetical protein
MVGVAVIATLAGIVGYVAARSGWVYLVEPFGSAVPRAKHVAFLTDLWAHDAAYLAGVLAGIVLCVWTWRRRGTLRGGPKPQVGHDDAPAVSEAIAVAAAVRPPWEVVVLRVLLIVGGVSLCLGSVFILVLSATWGI